MSAPPYLPPEEIHEIADAAVAAGLDGRRQLL